MHPSDSTSRLYLNALLCLVASLLSLFLALSYVLPPLPLDLLQELYDDSHYKYLVPLLVPTTAWFVIANWVGWEYFRFASFELQFCAQVAARRVRIMEPTHYERKAMLEDEDQLSVETIRLSTR